MVETEKQSGGFLYYAFLLLKIIIVVYIILSFFIVSLGIIKAKTTWLDNTDNQIVLNLVKIHDLFYGTVC